ncbi:MAG: response regulator transcription factor [Clostridiales bacterium]|jgi:DNA-binding response OmpR family regulator|nr:response regulator transcription factor [Clostridiales bacterium]MBQ4217325.1 response regulator transcription factor [Clostridiales bacterium]MBQ7627898.1 response regulator transcription factor [Clostridiales bacterium]MBR6210928.1 response regulator transcription factor [Clostridiales bacterium]
MYNVLLVEDDIQIREVIGDFFARRDEIRLDLAADGEIGLSKILNGQYDLIVLDIMMPGIDGFELCRIIRKRSDVPVVFLTGKVREEDVLYGYELGADDYIVKPFSIKVLYSKLLAILERTDTGRVTHKVLESGQIMLDPSKFEVTVGGEIIDLPPKEYLILKYMMEHPGTAITRRLLLAACWNDDSFITERVIDNRVKNLRKKLGKEGTRIKTLIGVGYRFD